MNDSAIPVWLRRHWRRALLVVPGALAVVAILLVVALHFVSDADAAPPRAEIGEVYDAGDSIGELGPKGTVFLPWAKIAVGASQPVDEIPGPDTDASANLRAPSGGSFVRVASFYLGPILSTSIDQPVSTEVEFLLRADGTDYDLGGPGGFDFLVDATNGDRWVAVDGHPDDLELVLRYAGVEQVVDVADGTTDNGRAAALDDIPGVGEAFSSNQHACGAFVRRDRSVAVIAQRKYLECFVQGSIRTPYVDGIGWAKDGYEFLVVRIAPPENVSVLVDDGSPTSTHYYTWPAVSATLGEKPTAVPTGNMDPDEVYPFGRDSVQLVFEVADDEPAEDLTLTMRIRARGQHGFTFRTEHLVLEWTIPGRRLA